MLFFLRPRQELREARGPVQASLFSPVPFRRISAFLLQGSRPLARAVHKNGFFLAVHRDTVRWGEEGHLSARAVERAQRMPVRDVVPNTCDADVLEKWKDQQTISNKMAPKSDGKNARPLKEQEV